MSYSEKQNVSLEVVTKIVKAYVSNNIVPLGELSNLISSVHKALPLTNGVLDSEEKQFEPREPAVPMSKSVKRNCIVCLEDGKELKTLRRHLQAAHGLTLEEYREKWGLPEDYPMVAPNYAKQRSELAKQIGLGRKSAKKMKTRKKAVR